MDLISILFRVFYWPICRAYARFLGDRPADTLLQYLCIPQYLKEYHCWPNFKHPQRFTEKVFCRQLYNRDPKMTMISDKLLVRDYVANKVGSEYLIPLLWKGEKPEEIPFNELPSKFVIKANHGCGYVLIVNDKMQLGQMTVIQQLNKWLGENFGEDEYLGIAWGYKNIKPTIMIESFIEENGKAPADYKFYCFSGHMEFFKIDFDRFEGHTEKFFDKDLNKLNLFEQGLSQYNGEINLAENFKQMVHVAETLSEEYEFMRVDLYSVKDRIYFGELTPYPGGVSAKFEPDRFDYVFGEKWKCEY